jgi:ADP-ribose pyrophosphatase YjhB (NUDIX family)
MLSTSTDAERGAQTQRVLTFVVGTYVVRKSRVLLMYHESLARWVPPGGRLDVVRGELPHEAAVRKTAEETGLTLSLHDLDDGLEVADGLAMPVPQPLLVQVINRENETYFDFAFVGTTGDQPVRLNYKRARAFHWFTASDLKRFPVVEHVAVHALRSIEIAAQETAPLSPAEGTQG